MCVRACVCVCVCVCSITYTNHTLTHCVCAQVSTEQNKITTLQADLNKRDINLLRLNEKVATLRAEKGDFQKQIDLQNHEMNVLRQEYSTQLR